MKNVRILKKALLIYYSAPLQQVFKQFRLGVVLFGIGLISVFVVNAYLEPSIKQEIALLVTLLITALGFVLAMTAQIRMLIIRCVQFTRN